LASKPRRRNKDHKPDSELKLKFESTAVGFKKDKNLDPDHDRYILWFYIFKTQDIVVFQIWSNSSICYPDKGKVS
jgi:hypothetical protein